MVTVRRGRTVVFGGLCGFGAGFVAWIGAHPFALWVPLVGAAIGGAYTGASEKRGRYAIDSVFTGATMGIFVWVALEVIAIPFVSSGVPAWSAVAIRGVFPAFAGWILYGATLGAAAHVLVRVGLLREGPRDGRSRWASADRTRIVILGGGFAGMTTALKLEEAFRSDCSVDIVLVSDNNALLFTPMLSEVAGGSVEPTHISSPLRSVLRRTRFIRAGVLAVDPERRRVELHPQDVESTRSEIPYDHLVLALGSVSNFFGQRNIESVALDFKTLTDAIRIRNRVIDLFERADRETEIDVRRRMLSFVVAGGGFAGVELAGALNDFARGILGDYPDLTIDDVSVTCVHARERILPELSETLAGYAQARMAERGVTFHLSTRVADATPHSILLEPGARTIAADTLIWTAGTAPNSLLASIDARKGERGAIAVDATMAVPGESGLWALGDCAAIPDTRTGGVFPPTAQHALREGAVLARNIYACVKGGKPQPFVFDSLGSLCVIGYQTACAEIRVPLLRQPLRFSGVFAWLMWRAIYVGKLPGFERKARVLVDWVTELFFPRDTVQTIDLT